MERLQPEARSASGMGMGRVLLEAVMVSVLGGVLALMANALSPRGLSLTRDYFPSTPRPAAAGDVQSQAGAKSPTAAGAVGGVGAVDQKLREHGLEAVSDERMHALFTDERYAQELVVFIDAREARRFQEGHIPGAYLFDRYRQDEFLPVVLPACQNAETVVVYCNGGDCEDSHFAALALRDAGVPVERLGVYSGGITSWQKRGHPLETGDRGSGVRVEEGRVP